MKTLPSLLYSDNPKPVLSKVEGSKTCGEPGRTIQKGPRRPKLVAALALASTFVAGQAVSQAQQPGRVYRIGILQSSSSEEAFIEGFRQGLRKLGYVEGKNVVLEARSGDMQPDRIANSVAEFVRLKVDIIVAGGAPAVVAAKKVSGTIPIVMRVGTDPVKSGLVTSLAHPGGNITGVASINVGLIGKRFELLTEVVPGAKRIAVLASRSDRSKFMATEEYKDMEAAARAVAAKLQVVLATKPTAIDNAFMAMMKERSQALIVIPSPSYLQQRERILKLAIKNRMPAIYPHSLFVEDGGLMSYGADFTDEYRRLAIFVDKILNGAKPADLPVEQPMKFELLFNLKAAKQIDLTIPPNVLVRADRVIR